MDFTRVMLIDDEVLALEYLRNAIPWEKNGYKIVAEISDSRKVIKQYEMLKPQILIVDIKMPGMNGLEISKKVLSYGEPVKIILLSAFKEFEYAKQAIEIGVCSYMLKHNITEKTLLTELNLARTKLKEDQSNSRMVWHQMIERSLRGQAGKPDVPCARSCNTYSTIMYLTVDTPFPVLQRPCQTRRINLAGIVDINKADPASSIHYFDLFEMEDNKFVAFVAFEKKHSQKEVLEQIYLLAADIQKKVASCGGATISIILTDISTDIAGIGEQYERVRKAAELSIFLGRGKINRLCDMKNRVLYDVTAIDACLAKIGDELKTPNILLLSDQLNELFSLVTFPQPSPAGLKLICDKLIELLRRTSIQNNIILPWEHDEGLMPYEQWYSAGDIKKWFLSEFARIFSEIEMKSHNKYSRIVSRATQIIQKDYARNLSVETLAESLNISEIYLSILFKRETGQTFLKYLTDYRMAIAKELLRKGDYKIYEIAEKVGYKTGQYFSQVFQKNTGRSPIDYRGAVYYQEDEH